MHITYSYVVLYNIVILHVEIAYGYYKYLSNVVITIRYLCRLCFNSFV